MTDKRLLASNGRVAHRSLEGEIDAETFTDGNLKQVAANLWLRDEPDGSVQRQLLFGDPFRVLEVRDSYAFGIGEKDGYVGYVLAEGLSDHVEPTHRVAVRTTWAWPAPDFKTEPVHDLHMNARLNVKRFQESWAEITLPDGSGFVPAGHIRPVDHTDDPVMAAHLMVGTPYVWGGNTGFGIDCSGLVQAALHAAGRTCPGDSDMQADLPGQTLEPDAPLTRGDLLFWNGHVAIVADETRLIHANAHHMAVAVEPVETAVSRIRATETGDVTRRLRVDLP